MEKIILQYPVELPPHPKVTELVLRRPKARDDLEARNQALTPDEVEIRLFALLTGQAFDVIAELDLETDYVKLQDAYRNFRRKPAATGAGEAPTSLGSNVSASPPAA